MAVGSVLCDVESKVIIGGCGYSDHRRVWFQGS